jgi:hypothetical protein
MNRQDALIHRFLDDRLSLAPPELDELIALLKADAELAAAVYDQLWLDDLLAQKLTLDRRNFVAQVEQRIADFERGQQELSRQVADVRAMAAAERGERLRRQRRAQRWRWALALSLAALGLGGAVAWRWLLEEHVVVARVTAVEGQVTLGEGDEAQPVQVDGVLESGQQLSVPPGGWVRLEYADGTQVRIKGDSAVTLGGETGGGGKQLRVQRGEVVAQVRPQRVSAMRFTTPHAVASASGSLLRLVVQEEATVLDVSEGQAKLERLGDPRLLTVTANESGLASRDTLQIRQVSWPDRRDGLAFLLSPLESRPEQGKPLVVARHPQTRHLCLASLEPRGAAILRDSQPFFELNGGYLLFGDAGHAMLAVSRGSSELTLEAIFSPASLDQPGPARIVALADESDDHDFALTQEGREVTFSLRTDTPPPDPAPLRVPLVESERPLHCTITYRHGELIAYLDGVEVARWKNLWGSLTAWRPGALSVGADPSGKNPWRGILEGFALYNRCLEPNEVARNAQNYRLLAGRGM